MNGDSKRGWIHVLKEHFSGKPSKSQFTVSETELKHFLNSGDAAHVRVSRTLESKDGVRYVREIDFGREVGIDKFTGNPTNIMTVLTDKFGNLITASPGIIN